MHDLHCYLFRNLIYVRYIADRRWKESFYWKYSWASISISMWKKQVSVEGRKQIKNKTEKRRFEIVINEWKLIFTKRNNSTWMIHNSPDIAFYSYVIIRLTYLTTLLFFIWLTISRETHVIFNLNYPYNNIKHNEKQYCH